MSPKLIDDWVDIDQAEPQKETDAPDLLDGWIYPNVDNGEQVQDEDEPDLKIIDPIQEGIKGVAKGGLGSLQLLTDQLPGKYPEKLSGSIEKAKSSQLLQPDPDYKRSEGWRGWVEDFFQMGPQVASQVGLALAPVPGSRLLSMGFMGSQIAGGDYNKLRAEGVSKGRAAVASVADAAIQAPLEMISLSKALKAWKPGKSVAKKLKQVAEATGTEFLTELVQKYPEKATEIWAKSEGVPVEKQVDQFVEDLWQTTKEGAWEGSIAAPYGGLTAGVNIALTPNKTLYAAKGANEELAGVVNEAFNRDVGEKNESQYWSEQEDIIRAQRAKQAQKNKAANDPIRLAAERNQQSMRGFDRWQDREFDIPDTDVSELAWKKLEDEEKYWSEQKRIIEGQRKGSTPQEINQTRINAGLSDVEQVTRDRNQAMAGKSDFLEKIDKMQAEVNNSETRGVNQEKVGQQSETVVFGASSPKWMQDIQEVRKARGEKALSRMEFNVLFNKAKNNIPMTDRQKSQYTDLEKAIQEYTGDTDEFAEQEKATDFERKGFEVYGGQRMKVSQLNTGDIFHGTVGNESGKFTIADIDSDGIATIQGKEKHLVDISNNVTVEAVKRAPVEGIGLISKAELEQEGYDTSVNGKDIPVTDLKVGDKIIGTIDGVKDEYTVKGINDNGEVLFQDGVTRRLDMFDEVSVDGIKRNNQEDMPPQLEKQAGSQVVETNRTEQPRQNLMGHESDQFDQFQEAFRDQKIEDFEKDLKRAHDDIQEYPDRPHIQPDVEKLRAEYEARKSNTGRQADEIENNTPAASEPSAPTGVTPTKNKAEETQAASDSGTRQISNTNSQELVFKPGATVTWQTKSGKTLSGKLIKPNKKRSGGIGFKKPFWIVQKDDGKKTLVLEKDLDRSEQSPKSGPQAESEKKKTGDYGNKNKVFTKSAAEKARETLKQKLSGNQLNSGIDPEIMLAGIQLAGYHIEAGARTFAAYSKAMVQDVGETIKPYLRSFYEGVRHYPGFDSHGMDSFSDLDKTQGENIKKDHDARIDDKYAEILELPEDVSGSEILDEIDSGTLTPRSLDKYLDESEELEGDIDNIKAAIANRIGDLKETYRYESEKEGEALEEYLDSLLTIASKDRVSRNSLQDRNTKTSKTDKTQGVSDDSRITKKEGDNVTQHDTSTDIERDRGKAEPIDTMGKEGIPDEPGPAADVDGTGVQQIDQEEDTANSGKVISGHETPPVGKQGDQSPYSTDRPDIPEGSITGSDDDRGGVDIGISGPQYDRIPASTVVKAAQKSNDIKSSIAAQKKAEKVKSISADLSNIRETLPLLHPGQQEDVFFAERRFEKPDGHGVMFTNGTGTGKTFSGLGIVKRFVRSGKSNVLIIAPDNVIINAWMGAAKMFDLPVHKLSDTKDAGQGVTITTYANFRDNKTLVSRDWDLVVADESHELSMNKAGTKTGSLTMFRAITKHPRGAYDRAEFLHPDLFENRHQSKVGRKAWQAAVEKVSKDVLSGKNRSKAVFLSATPFAYEKNIDYAEGYLFNYGPDRDSDAYNSTDAYQQFMVEHFGYRMRYNKLTEPDQDVNRGLMQRQFNSWLKEQGVLSSRVLSVDHDYDRRFILTESAVGQKIDEGLEFLGKNRKEYDILHGHITEDFDYLQRRYLLEAIKAKEVIPIIKDHLAHGRKVVVFHDYIKGGAGNPFDVRDLVDHKGDNGEVDKLGEQARNFVDARPDLVNLPINNLLSPLNALKNAFPDLMVVNGQTVSKKDVQANINKFNDDKTGPSVLMVQSDKDKGWSGHDTTGKYPRVLINLGLPTRPTRSIQQEGRIYRVGQASDAMFRYLNTGTNWERWAFASTIARRASAAENLAMGEEARALQDSFINAFEESDIYPAGGPGEGKGGKAQDQANNAALTEWDRAISFYFGQQKKTSRTKAQEGKDYFATPEPLGLKMVEWAGIQSGDRILEPSAGHGAIARWFPENVNSVAIEPSDALSSRLKMVTPDSRVIQGRFEDHHITNKYNAIVMNPPFGSAGKTAMEHIEKAFKHLKNGGRIVAIIPQGPAMDKRMDKFLYGEDVDGNVLNPDAHLSAQYTLPPSTFERAGTKVAAKVVIIDKQHGGGSDQAVSMDFSQAKNIKDLFSKIKDVEAPGKGMGKVEPDQRKDRIARVNIPVGAQIVKDNPLEPVGLNVVETGHSVYPWAVMGNTYEHKEVIKSVGDRGKRMWNHGERAWWFKQDPTQDLVEKLVGGAAEDKAKFSTGPGASETDAFKKWFGDSKVVDDDGKPLVVYHGTPDARFIDEDGIFKSEQEKYGFGKPTGVHWFTPSKAAADTYADDMRAFDYQMAEPGVVATYLKIENPLIIEAGGKKWRDAQKRGRTSDVIQHAQEQGHDGVIIKNVRDYYQNNVNLPPIDTYAVFDSRQIKSVDNAGTFDPENPDIRYSITGKAEAPGQGLSNEQIISAFSNQDITVNSNGSISIMFENGQGVVVETVRQMDKDSIEMAIRSGRMDKSGVIYGKFQNDTITLNTSVADYGTIIHEIKHMLDKWGVVTRGENRSLDRHRDRLIREGKFRYEVTGNVEEDRANTLAQIVIDRDKFRGRGLLFKLAQKVTDFIDGLLGIAGKRTATGLARGVESGAVYSRNLRTVEENISPDLLPLFKSEENATYKIRKDPLPKKTIKAYKAFRYIEGQLYPMFVGSTGKGESKVTPLLMGEWMDALDGGYHFTGSNGREYVPTFNGRGGASQNIEKTSLEVRQKLVDLGYIKSVNTKNATAVAYRPGWHAGHLPYFPQGGTKDKSAPHGMRHEWNTVIAEVEMNADVNLKNEFMETAEYSKAGKIKPAMSGIRRIPTEGYYEYSTNPKFYSEGYSQDKWYIAGSLKINRILPSREVDQILKDNNVEPQLWAGEGPLFSTSKDQGQTVSDDDFLKEKFHSRGSFIENLKDSINEGKKEFADKTIANTVDSLHFIKKRLGDEAYKLHRVLTGIKSASFSMFLEHGKMSWDGNALTVKDRNNGFLPFIRSIGDDWQKLFYWVAAKRAEKLASEGRENWLLEEDRKRILKITGTHSKKGESWVSLNKKFQGFNKNVLDVMTEAGLIDPESRAIWESNIYIPFYRVMEDDITRQEFLSGPRKSKQHISSQIRKLKGGQAKVGDLLENVLMNWMHGLDAAARNKARSKAFEVGKDVGIIHEVDKKDLVNLLGTQNVKKFAVIKDGKTRAHSVFDNESDAKAFVQKLTNSGKRGYRVEQRKETKVLFGSMQDFGILSFQKNGKPVYFKTDDVDLYMALGEVDTAAFQNLFMKIMGQAKRTLSYGATFGPAFRLRNMIRDTVHTAVVSKSFRPFVDTAIGFVDSMKENKDYIEFMASGFGFGSSYVSSDDPQTGSKFIKKILKTEGKGAAKRILDTPAKMLAVWEKIGSASENAARIGLYKNLKKKGYTKFDAGFEGRDLMDFSMHGRSQSIQIVARIVPFLNARVQGLYKLGRSAHEDPRSFCLKSSILTAASLLLWSVYKDDERYIDLEDWDKWTYYHFWLRDDHYRIPKPFEVGALFSSLPETVFNVWNDTDDGRIVVEWFKHTAMDIFNIDIPQLFKPIVEDIYNYDTFRGHAVVPDSLSKLKSSEQYTPWTSGTMRAFGEAFDISPIRLEHLIRGYFSTIGSMALFSTDILTRQAMGYPSRIKGGPNPFMLRIRDPHKPRSTKHITRFYDLYKKIDSLNRTLNDYVKSGQKSKATSLYQENKQLLKLKAPASKIRTELSKINRLKKQVLRDKDLTGMEKRIKIDKLNGYSQKLTKRFFEKV